MEKATVMIDELLLLAQAGTDVSAREWAVGGINLAVLLGTLGHVFMRLIPRMEQRHDKAEKEAREDFKAALKTVTDHCEEEFKQAASATRAIESVMLNLSVAVQKNTETIIDAKNMVQHKGGNIEQQLNAIGKELIRLEVFPGTEGKKGQRR